MLNVKVHNVADMTPFFLGSFTHQPSMTTEDLEATNKLSLFYIGSSLEGQIVSSKIYRMTKR